LENYVQTQKALNSLKQHAFSFKICPIIISNLVVLPYYVKTLAHLTMIDLMIFLEI